MVGLYRVNRYRLLIDNGLNMCPDCQYLGQNALSKKRERIDPLIKNVAKSIGLRADSVGVVDDGVLSLVGASLS